VANRLDTMLTLKARAELALGRTVAALATAREALTIAEADVPQPGSGANVGAALMAVAEAQRAAGDADGARTSARRATTALAHGLGPDHSETRAASQFQ
jgi:hypothetical protein